MDMLITTGIILLLAFLLAPIILIRFRKRWVAAFNLAVTNRITSRFAARLPGFGILAHVGRKSGVYRTPDWGDRFHAAFNFSWTRGSVVTRVESVYLSYIS
jgi:hypothetical protein